jgi:NAD(P)-dependent dehydrogenase (short-subunit alcohol dehydrogenase family)
MQLKDATVFVTGANRGIGRSFVEAALARGAKKVYAAARKPESIATKGALAVPLDVTSQEDVRRAAALAHDTTLLINNAGIATLGSFQTDDAEQSLRRHMEVNVFGVLRMSQAFAPILARNGGGALLNVASIASFISGPLLANYAVSKAALWSLSNGLRHDLQGQGTQVLSLHMGFVDTDLTHGIDAPKASPEDIVNAAFDALEAGQSEVLADETTRHVKRGLSLEPAVYLLPR